MDAVAPRATPKRDNEIAGARGLGHVAAWNEPDAARVDHRVAHVVAVEADRAVDRRDAHAVAVVSHASGHALEQAKRVHAALGHISVLRPRIPKAEDIGVGDRASTQPRTEDVPDHATYPRACAAVGLDGAGVVVRLDFHAHAHVAIECDHPRVVREHGPAPVWIEFLCGCEHGLLEQVVVAALSLLVAHADGTGERLVLAVFAPSLGEGFEFDVRRFTPQLAKVGLDRLHLEQSERETHRRGQRGQRAVRGRAQSHDAALGAHARGTRKLVLGGASGGDRLNHIVAQHARRRSAHARRCARGPHEVGAREMHPRHVDLECGECVSGALCFGQRDTGSSRDGDGAAPRTARRQGEGQVLLYGEHVLHGVREEGLCRAGHSVGRQLALEEPDPHHPDAGHARDARLAQGVGGFLALGIHQVAAASDLDAVDGPALGRPAGRTGHGGAPGRRAQDGGGSTSSCAGGTGGRCGA